MANFSTSLRSHHDYTIACICPMGVELAAVEGMLDEIHTPLATGRDQNAYTLGTIADHSIVVAVMPKTGTSPASAVATQLRNDFPSIRFGFLVGIGGGVPGTADVRLGDVVVSQSTGTVGGVVQYDLGKKLANGQFKRTGMLNEPPEVLSASVRKLESQHRRVGHQITSLVAQMIDRYPKMARDYAFPAAEQDRLFQSSHLHGHGPTCGRCDTQYLVQRSQRLDQEPWIHYGTIGSANVVMKDAIQRDQLKSDSDADVLCVEMEAAGLRNGILPCLVIRGICDYADSHKNDKWQPYAAAVAAAYMKELLQIIPAQQTVHGLSDEEIDQAILASLAFSQMQDRRLDVQRQALHPNTCQWILSLPTYQEWLAQSHGLLWIKGKPGAGKSTLMSSMYASTRDHPSASSCRRLEFFFNARGAPLQHTFTGMLRSLLNQVLQCAPQCREIIRRYYRGKFVANGLEINVCEWHEVELRKLFLESVVAAAQHQQILIFVDALDEAGESVARDIAEYLHTVDLHTSVASALVKICISCRHYPIVSEIQTAEVCVEDHNHADITAYVKGRLELVFNRTGTAGANSEGWALLQKAMIERAAGVFQWVCLVMNVVEECIYDGLGPDDILPEFENLPGKMSDIYEHIILNVIKPRFRSNSFILFQWTCLAEEPLTVEEMRYALAAAAAVPQSRYSKPIRCIDTPDFVKTNEIMAQRVRTISGGLLEVVEGRVQVVHQTVNEYLVKKGLALLASFYTVNCSTPFAERRQSVVTPEDINIVYECQSRLYWCCLKYLAIEMKSTEWGATYVHLPFIKYAVQNVLIHAEKASQHRSQSLADQIELLSRIARFWTNAYQTLFPFSTRCPSGVRTPLQMAACAGLSDITSHLLQHHNMENRNELHEALCLAAQWGHEPIVRLLLNSGAVVHSNPFEQWQPLTIAAANGHLGIISILLEQGAELNGTDGNGADALESAALAGYDHVVWMLLASGLNINTQEISARALQAASINSHEKVVQILLDVGVDVNASGGLYGSALRCAATCGHEKVVRILLDAGANIDAQNAALIAASANDHEKVARMLIKARVVGGVPEETYCDSVHLAATAGHEKTVRVLLGAGIEVNDTIREQFGLTLQVVVGHGYEKIARLLVDAKADVNFQGGLYGSALRAARDQEMIQMLLDAGAQYTADSNDLDSDMDY